jgi:hypothetical protein
MELALGNRACLSLGPLSLDVVIQLLLGDLRPLRLPIETPLSPLRRWCHPRPRHRA